MLPSRYGFKYNTNDKRLVDAIDDVLRVIKDYSKYNFDRYVEMCKVASESKLIDTFKNPLYVKLVPGSEPSQRHIRKILEKEQIVTEEFWHMNYKYRDEQGRAPISRVKLIALPCQVRRPQQIAAKENKSIQDSSATNATGQATGKSRSGTYSDTEIVSSISIGQEHTIKEFMSPRSNNAKAREFIRKQIIETGEVSLKDMPDSDTNKKTLRYMDVYFKTAGLIADLIDDPDIVS